MTAYVIDSYALLALYWREPGWDDVARILRDRRNTLWMSVINRGEAYYKVARAESVVLARLMNDWTDDLGIRFVPADWSLTLAAAQIKSEFALSYADCFAAALARMMRARVVTGDPEFAKVERAGIVEMEWLPGRPKKR